MNTKLSGCQLVLVPIQRVGHNNFLFSETLKGRVIKYMDFYGCRYLPDTTAAGLQTTEDMFITIMDEYGNTALHNELPLERLDFIQTQGMRTVLGQKISLEKCYIDCKNPAAVGKVAAFVCWYDLPEYSAANKTDKVVTDYISVPLTTSVRYNKLPDEDRMTGKRFRRILAATPTVTPDFQTGVESEQLPNLYLTLRKGSFVVCEHLPLAMLVQLQMLHKSTFANIIFDMQSSYITIGGQGTIPGVTDDYIGKSVFLNLQYEK